MTICQRTKLCTVDVTVIKLVCLYLCVTHNKCATHHKVKYHNKHLPQTHFFIRALLHWHWGRMTVRTQKSKCIYFIRSPQNTDIKLNKDDSVWRLCDPEIIYFILAGQKKLRGLVCLKKFHGVSLRESSGDLRSHVICFKSD